MKKIEGGVTAAKGFMAAGVHAGIKKNGKKDMAMIFCTEPCKTAGVFTTNVVKAAPVKWDSRVIEESDFTRAVVINSGVANACTGEEGYGYCISTATEAGAALNVPAESVLLASTGVIGKQLPMETIKAGIPILKQALREDAEAGRLAAEAIMTTDTVSKQSAYEFEIGGRTAVIGGMCKGSGMIHPNMATMLCFITTDAAISKELLSKALKNDVKDTFNMISVDGDTSTNDSVLLMADGLAGNAEIMEENEEYREFCKALNAVMTDLCRKIAGDGEGATALFEVKVINADTKENARILSKSVVMSSLTKAAIFGHDANWGRILCALGYSGVSFEPENVDLYFESAAGRIKIVENGTSTGYSEEEATKILSEPEVTATADMKMGNESAVAWGCDLTYDYVKINADYRS